MNFYFLTTGYCTASGKHIITGGTGKTVKCQATVALLRHPMHGWILFDTGYAPRVLDATVSFPYSLYRQATPLFITEQESVAAQLPRFRLTVGDIATVVLSHFHADHLGGVKDFPHSRLVAAWAGYEDVRNRTGFAALKRAFLPDLMPEDFATRATLIDRFDGPELGPLGQTFDLFGDETVLLVPLPGHARGQIGLYTTLTEKPTLFVADACYLTRSIHENRPPNRITDLFSDDGNALRQTLTRLHEFHIERPDVTLIPTHCPKAFARFGEVKS